MYVCVSGGHIMLIFKSVMLTNFWTRPNYPLWRMKIISILLAVETPGKSPWSHWSVIVSTSHKHLKLLPLYYWLLLLHLIFRSVENHQKQTNPADIYLLKVNNRNTRTKSEICSKLTTKIQELRHWRRCFTPCCSVSIVNFEHTITGLEGLHITTKQY